MRKLRCFDPRRGIKLSSWIAMIAANAAYDFLRRAARRPALEADDDAVDAADDPMPSPLAMLIDKEEQRELVAMQAVLATRSASSSSSTSDFDADAGRDGDADQPWNRLHEEAQDPRDADARAVVSPRGGVTCYAMARGHRDVPAGMRRLLHRPVDLAVRGAPRRQARRRALPAPDRGAPLRAVRTTGAAGDMRRVHARAGGVRGRPRPGARDAAAVGTATRPAA